VCPALRQLLLLLLVLLLLLQDTHEEVAVEAAEFWMTFCDVDMDLQLLQPVLGRLIPVLLKNMVGVLCRLQGVPHILHQLHKGTLSFGVILQRMLPLIFCCTWWW
jgi:hypothetical protein